MINEIEQDDEIEEPVMVPADSRITFIKKNDLERVKKRLGKSVDKAILFMESVVVNEEADLKTRMNAAQYIITTTKELSESIARDQLSRLVAESRLLLAQNVSQRQLKNAGSGSADSEEEQENMPLYQPNMIVDHSAISHM